MKYSTAPYLFIFIILAFLFIFFISGIYGETSRWDFQLEEYSIQTKNIDSSSSIQATATYGAEQFHLQLTAIASVPK